MNEHDPDNICSNLAGEQATLANTGELARNKALILPNIKAPFEPDRQDGIFALFAFVLGFYFVRWVLFSWQGWGVTLFTIGYCAAVTIYFLKRGVTIPRVGWFWLTIVLLTGMSFSLWTDNGLEPWRSLLLFSSAVYWILCATGLLVLGKTSNWIVLDGFNGLILIPFKNFVLQYKSLAFLGRNKRAEGKQIFSIALGLFLTLIVAAIVAEGGQRRLF